MWEKRELNKEAKREMASDGEVSVRIGSVGEPPATKPTLYAVMPANSSLRNRSASHVFVWKADRH
jgi:hypothetical protein